MSIPSRGDDEYGWEDEVQGWTGGPKGGTDPRLGWRGRHVIRAAWMYQTWGAGPNLSAIRGQGLFESDYNHYEAVRGMIGVDATSTKPDEGYAMARVYLDVALDIARAKGLVFPPTLSVLRPAGPPSTVGMTQGDPAVVDLLLLKAGALERMGSPDATSQAKDIYEQILSSIHSDSSPKQEARIMRLADKVGSMSARLGDEKEASAWWAWGLKRVGIELPEEKAKTDRWFSKSATTTEQPTLPTALSPTILRATISLLTSASTHLVSQSQVANASALQSTALSLLPAPRLLPRPDPSTAGQILHQTWIEQRSSLLALHLASTTYALGRPALNLANIASTRADNVVDALTPVPTAYTSALASIAQNLRLDSLLTAAEASYTRGLLLERSPNPPLDTIAECFERAMSLNAEETGKTESGAMGEEWQKYWTSFVRVKQKLGQPVDTISPTS